MSRRKVLLTDYAWPDLSIERSIFDAAGVELVVAEATDPDALAAAAAGCEAIVTNWARVPAEVIEAAAPCRIVARLGVGIDNIDVAYCTRRRIPVTNCPDYCVAEVAEHALALLLALARKVAFYHWATKRGQYDLKAGPALRRIEGQTLGIVGFGHIGRALAARARGIGLRVVATSRSRREMPPAVEWRTFDDLLAESDYVSLHVPSTRETHNLVDARVLGMMKRGAYLVNTSRGAVVDEAALHGAIASGHLAGAALDVQAEEPPDLARPLFGDERVIVTPHAAFVSEESLAELRTRVARQVVDRLEGRVPENVVNPAVFE